MAARQQIMLRLTIGEPVPGSHIIDIHELPVELLEKALTRSVVEAHLPGRDKDGGPAYATLRPLGSWKIG